MLGISKAASISVYLIPLSVCIASGRFSGGGKKRRNKTPQKGGRRDIFCRKKKQRGHGKEGKSAKKKQIGEGLSKYQKRYKK